MWPRRAQEIQIKTPEQFAVMREAGLVVAHTLGAVAAALRPGVTTAALDALAAREVRAAGAARSVLGYHRCPASACRSDDARVLRGVRGCARGPGWGGGAERMVRPGSPEPVLRDDGRTVVTADGSGAARFEHPVAIPADGPWVLPAEDGGLARLGDTRHRDPASVPPS